MKNEFAPRNSAAPRDSKARLGSSWFLMAGCALVILIGLSRRSRYDEPSAAAASPERPEASHQAGTASNLSRAHRFARGADAEPALTVEEIIAAKVRQFGRSRRELAREMGRPDLLIHSGREIEARQIFEEFIGLHPGQRQALERFSRWAY